MVEFSLFLVLVSFVVLFCLSVYLFSKCRDTKRENILLKDDFKDLCNNLKINRVEKGFILRDFVDKKLENRTLKEKNFYHKQNLKSCNKKLRRFKNLRFFKSDFEDIDLSSTPSLQDLNKLSGFSFPNSHHINFQIITKPDSIRGMNEEVPQTTNLEIERIKESIFVKTRSFPFRNSLSEKNIEEIIENECVEIRRENTIDGDSVISLLKDNYLYIGPVLIDNPIEEYRNKLVDSLLRNAGETKF